MSLAEDCQLASFEVNVVYSTVTVTYKERVLRDGVPFSERTHSGAYELVAGNLPDFIKEQLELSMESLCGEALISFTKANADLRNESILMQAELAGLNESLQIAFEERGDLHDEVIRLQGVVIGCETVNSELNVINKVLESDLESARQDIILFRARILELEALNAGA